MPRRDGRCGQAWELADADNAEKLIRNLTRRLDQDAGCGRHHPKGLDDILSVVGLKLPCGVIGRRKHDR